MASSPPHGGTTARTAGSLSIAVSSAARCCVRRRDDPVAAQALAHAAPRSRARAATSTLGRAGGAAASWTPLDGAVTPIVSPGRSGAGKRTPAPLTARNQVVAAPRARPPAGARPRRRTSTAARGRAAGRRGRGSRGSRRAAHSAAVTSRISGCGQRHVAAAPGRVARRGRGSTPSGASSSSATLDGVRGQGHRLRAHRGHPHLVEQRRACPASPASRRTGGVPESNRRMPAAGRVVGAHQEGVGGAHPALDRLRRAPRAAPAAT